MVRVGVTSIVRHAVPGERSGYFRVIDLESRKVVSETALPESASREIDPNPRGGYRGAKGIGLHGDRIVIANSERLFVFDRSWRLEADLTHHYMGSVHDVLAEQESIWVTCTNCDLLLRLGWDGEVLDEWTWREDPVLARSLGYGRAPPFDRSRDYRDPRSAGAALPSLVQLNALARDGQRLLVSFGRVLPRRAYLRKHVAATAARLRIPLPERPATRPSRLPAGAEPGSSSALVALEQNGAADVVYRAGDATVPSHNVLVAEGCVLYNDTCGGRLVELDRAAWTERRSVAVPGEASFPRGLARLAGDRYLVGSQRPAAVHVLDLAEGRAVDTFPFSDDERESVYALAVLPGSLDEPPPRVAFPDALASSTAAK
jgi:hypothetical protein